MAYKYPYDDEEKTYQPPKLKTNRNMWKLMIFNILTLGLYGVSFFTPLSHDLDDGTAESQRFESLSHSVTTR